MKVSRIRAQLGLSKPTLGPQTHTTIHDFPNKSRRPTRPPLFWEPLLTRPCTAWHTKTLQTQHTHALLQIKIWRLIEQYSSNGFIHQWFYLCTHKHTCSLSSPTKRSCSPLFLRKLAENLLNPSLLLLLCCVSAGASSRRASETGAIRTRAGPRRIGPFCIEANEADYRKTLRYWYCSTVRFWRWFDSTESYQRASGCLILPLRS